MEGEDGGKETLSVEYIVGGREVGQVRNWKEFEHYETGQRFWIDVVSFELCQECPYSQERRLSQSSEIRRNSSGEEQQEQQQGEDDEQKEHEAWLAELKEKRRLAKMFVERMHANKKTADDAASLYATRAKESGSGKKLGVATLHADELEEKKRMKSSILEQAFSVGEIGQWERYVHRTTGDEFFIHKQTLEITPTCPEEILEDLAREDSDRIQKAKLQKESALRNLVGNIEEQENSDSDCILQSKSVDLRSTPSSTFIHRADTAGEVQIEELPPAPPKGSLQHAATTGVPNMIDSPSAKSSSSATFSGVRSKEPRHKYVEILSEIISTEETYYKELSAVLDIYVAWLRSYASGQKGQTAANKLGISIEQIDSIFGPNLEEIRFLSGQMLAKLKASQKEDLHSVKNIASLFLEMSTNMHAYAPYNSSYSSNYMVLKEQIKRLKKPDGIFSSLTRVGKSKYPTFLSIWETFSAANLRSETIFSFLIKPVQRIPRYCLLLKELKKSMPDTFKHADLLEEVCSVYQKVTSEINESVRAHEKLVRILGDELDTPRMSRKLSNGPNPFKITNIYGDAVSRASMSLSSPASSASIQDSIQSQAPKSRRKLSKML